VLVLACGESTSKKSSEAEDTTKEVLEEDAQGVVLCFGNSLTAGMGLDPNLAFPAVLQQKMDSLEFNYKVINAGLSGETTAGGKNRIQWILNQKVDVFILELGANDGLRGIPLDATRSNLQEIINAVKLANPEVQIILAGMQIPPNMGPEYTSEFRSIFPELAKTNELLLIPFLLKDVAGIKDLNQRDGIHPTAEGQKIVANNVWDILAGTLKK
jgi:acyl-CoA thioesterase-1